jgi:hypothetical protein
VSIKCYFVFQTTSSGSNPEAGSNFYVGLV